MNPLNGLRSQVAMPALLVVGGLVAIGGTGCETAQGGHSTTDWANPYAIQTPGPGVVRGAPPTATGDLAALTKERNDWAKRAQEIEGQVAALTKERNDWAALANQLKGEVATLTKQTQEMQRQLDAYKTREGNGKKVLFIEGLNSTNLVKNLADSRLGGFEPLQAALARAGYGQQDLLRISYAGGSLNGLGEYVPGPYQCAATRRALTESVRTVLNLLSAYRQARPDVELVLVGHSLGGRVALEAAQVGPNPPKVVTIDSPLQQMSQSATLVSTFYTVFVGPCTGGDVLNDLNRARTWPGQNQDRVLTVGSRNDCVYNPRPCFGVGADASGVQVAPGAQHYWARTAPIGNPSASHTASLADPPTLARIVAFIGPPVRSEPVATPGRPTGPGFLGGAPQ